MSTDKSHLLNPNQQYQPPVSASAPGYSGPPTYSCAQLHQYQSHPGNAVADPWKGGPIVAQPQVQIAPPNIHMPRPWSSGLCDCGNKPGACVFSYFCPCLFTGQLARRMGSSYAYGCWCGRHLEVVSRPYLRAKHNIDGDFCSDCLITSFCGHCSLCQIDRELDYLGYP